MSLVKRLVRRELRKDVPVLRLPAFLAAAPAANTATPAPASDAAPMVVAIDPWKRYDAPACQRQLTERFCAAVEALNARKPIFAEVPAFLQRQAD